MEPPDVPTVYHNRDGMLVELVYDPDRRTTALAVSRAGTLRIEQDVLTDTGERLVPYAASNNLIRHGCVQLPGAPVVHGRKADLLADIEAYLNRYVDLSPLFAKITAHYVLLSWVHDAFNELPYLRFAGDYGSGKTRALIAVGSIVYRGFFASGASTVSPIFHVLDTFGGTLVLDEADLRFSDKSADLVKILNNGTVKGLPVLRTLQNRNKEFNPAAFTVFGPKIVAMRGSFRDDALESRFLTETMGERPLRPDIPIHLPHTLKTEALALRNRLLHYRLTELAKTASLPDRIVQGIGPRLNQTALSLLSLVDDEDTRSDIAALLRAQHSHLARTRASRTDARVLRALSEVFADPAVRSVPLRAVADRATASEPGGLIVTPRDAGQILRARNIALHKSHGTIVVSRPQQPAANVA